MSANPTALQLRFLQTVLEMSSERSRTVIVPFPLELVRQVVERYGQVGAETPVQTP